MEVTITDDILADGDIATGEKILYETSFYPSYRGEHLVVRVGPHVYEWMLNNWYRFYHCDPDWEFMQSHPETPRFDLHPDYAAEMRNDIITNKRFACHGIWFNLEVLEKV